MPNTTHSTRFNWEDEAINVLGIDVSNNISEDIAKNYDKAIEKARCVLKSWSSRSLSLIGKVTLVNSLVASLFVYKMQVLPNMPVSSIKKIEKCIEEFIWNGHKPKISLRTLQLPKKMGGLNLVNFCEKDMALKLQWVKLYHEDLQIENLARTLLIPDMGGLIWRCNISGKDVPQIVPDSVPNNFWLSVLAAWSEINYTTELRYNHIILVQ